MSKVFQLPTAGESPGDENRFWRFGLADNPFPTSGVGSGVYYTGHMEREVVRVNSWISEMAKARGAFSPLAIAGSLGAGKTHLLGALEQGLRTDEKTHVLRRPLTEEGMTRIVLANLILRHTPLSDPEEHDAEPGIGLLRKIVEALQDSIFEIDDVLSEGSPLRAPLYVLRQSDEDDGSRVLWLCRWMRREYTTPAQRAKIGLSGVLESEGQAIRVIGDLLRLARAARLVQVWFIMIDQLEELWREGVITPSRRARFLTDVRLLVDQGLEGAPIAVLLAWNTHTSALQWGNVDEEMQRDYLALWQRLGEPVDLPALRKDDTWPFAEAYLKHVGITSTSDGEKKALYSGLRMATQAVIESLEAENDEDRFAPRHVLREWREKAIEIASGTNS